MMLGNTLLNFAIGALRAVELVRVAPVIEAIPMLSKVAVDVSDFMGTVPKLGADAKALVLEV